MPEGGRPQGRRFANAPRQQYSQQPQRNQRQSDKQCKRCGEYISRYANVCPNCGASQKAFYQRVWFWVSIFILLVLVGVVVTIYNCTSKVQGILEPINTINTIDTNDATDANAEENTADKYSITDEAMESQPLGMYKITGTFTNLTDKEIGYVQVSYNLYDEAGAQIGTAFVNTNNLAAGAQWKFEALCLSTTGDVEPASFKVSDVTGF